MSSSRSSARDRIDPANRRLFSSPYWYEGTYDLPDGTYSFTEDLNRYVLFGSPRTSGLPDTLVVKLGSIIGTAAQSHWALASGAIIDIRDLQIPPVPQDHVPVAGSVSGLPHTPGEDVGDAAVVAREVRELSGMTADQLAALFPAGGPSDSGRAARETFQRWVSGSTQPSSANLTRLLALRHLLRQVALRLPDVKSWLITPSEGLGHETPYEALRLGAMSRLWPLLAAMPARSPHQAVVHEPEDLAHRMTESLRGADSETPEAEYDDGADWFGD